MLAPRHAAKIVAVMLGGSFSRLYLGRWDAGDLQRCDHIAMKLLIANSDAQLRRMRHRIVITLIGLSGLIGLGYFYGRHPFQDMALGELAGWTFTSANALSEFIETYFLSPWFAVFVILVLALERIKPAVATQPLVSRGLVYDAAVAVAV